MHGRKRFDRLIAHVPAIGPIADIVTGGPASSPAIRQVVNTRAATLLMLMVSLAACSPAGTTEVANTDCTPVSAVPRAVANPGVDLMHWTQAALPMRSSTVAAAVNQGPLPFVETRRFCSTSPEGEAHCTIYECSSTGEAIRCLEYYVSAREVDGDAAGALEGGDSASSEVPAVAQPEPESSSATTAAPERAQIRMDLTQAEYIAAAQAAQAWIQQQLAEQPRQAPLL